jgi:hypothetical protein
MMAVRTEFLHRPFRTLYKGLERDEVPPSRHAMAAVNGLCDTPVCVCVCVCVCVRERERE